MLKPNPRPKRPTLIQKRKVALESLFEKRKSFRKRQKRGAYFIRQALWAKGRRQCIWKERFKCKMQSASIKTDPAKQSTLTHEDNSRNEKVC